MRLGVSYTVFDGIELLEKSIDQIREHVYLIQVCYQKVSWFGSKILDEDLETLHRLKSEGKIDDLYEFTNFEVIRPDSPRQIQSSKYFEMRKRQVGLAWAKAKACTHFMSMDVDEFYDSSEFKRAKDLVLLHNIDSTSVSFINYVKLPTIHRGYDPTRVPFICRIGRHSTMQSRFFVKVDPTRGISPYGNTEYDFPRDHITMHHMESVRSDLSRKYDSTTRAIFIRGRQDELINSISSVTEDSNIVSFNKIIFPSRENFELFKVENKFNINI